MRPHLDLLDLVIVHNFDFGDFTSERCEVKLAGRQQGLNSKAVCATPVSSHTLGFQNLPPLSSKLLQSARMDRVFEWTANTVLPLCPCTVCVPGKAPGPI